MGTCRSPGHLSAFFRKWQTPPTPSHNSVLEEGETSTFSLLSTLSLYFRKMGLGLFSQVNYLHWRNRALLTALLSGRTVQRPPDFHSNDTHTHTPCSTCPSLIQEGQAEPTSWGTRKLPKRLSYSHSSGPRQQLGLGPVRLAHPRMYTGAYEHICTHWHGTDQAAEDAHQGPHAPPLAPVGEG